jgi:Xaa-Pro aminopeptidase
MCGEPNKHQIDAYETASKWINASIDMIRPGATPDEVASVWPDAHEFGYRDEAEAFLLQYGHGIGLSLWSVLSSQNASTAKTRRYARVWFLRSKHGKEQKTVRARPHRRRNCGDQRWLRDYYKFPVRPTNFLRPSRI